VAKAISKAIVAKLAVFYQQLRIFVTTGQNAVSLSVNVQSLMLDVI